MFLKSKNQSLKIVELSGSITEPTIYGANLRLKKLKNIFQKDFLWVASSSAFKIEGAWDEDGKGMIVDDFNSFKKSDIQADSKVASDFYHNWKNDIDLMKELDLKTYRFSLSFQDKLLIRYAL